MAPLKGNLSERQKQLNAIVSEAAKIHSSFEDITTMRETTDIEKIIKIDLAKKFENLDYIMEVLKGGDSLYITRALKQSWIYDAKYSNKINAKYLEQNIFPYMSVKMKRKFLTFISKYVKESERIVEFAKCCMEVPLTKLALKFVVRAPEAFKTDYLTNNPEIFEQILSKTYLIHFIGKSFKLADKLLSLISLEYNKLHIIHNIRHLYSLNNTNYLDMVERYVKFTPFTNFKRMGLITTKDLMQKYKERIVNNARIYINFLHIITVAKQLTPDEAKKIITDLHPETVEQYWRDCFCLFYENIINVIPSADRYQFLKTTFSTKYASEEFENSNEFYNKKIYKFMTEEEKLEWINNKIKNQPDIYTKSYSLYHIVTFDTAFEKITNLIKTCDSSETRFDMMLYILPTVEDKFHIKRLLEYYRDSSESELVQMDFINRLLRNHQAYHFDKDCWAVLNEIFIKLKVYDFSADCNDIIQNFRSIAIFYDIINKNDLSKEWKTYISENDYLDQLLTFSRRTHITNQEKLYTYLFDFYLEKICDLEGNDELKELLQKYVKKMLDLMIFYNKTKNDIPDVIMDILKTDTGDLKNHKLLKVSSRNVTPKELMKMLNVDPTKLVDKLPLIIKTQEISNNFRVSQLFKKLKVYFSNDNEDIALKFVDFYNKLLSSKSLSKSCAEAATSAIFLLADDAFKIHFLKSNVPTDDEKIKTDAKKIRIQHAICATVFQSRPPVPVEHIVTYIKGPYVRSCLHLITSYLINLPLTLCTEFLNDMLQMRSIAQERSIHVAFTCYTAEELRKIIMYIWKKNKNPSVRLILYSTLYKKVCNERVCAQAILFKNLIEMTSDLEENDANNIFKLLVAGDLPEHLVSTFAHAAWLNINSFTIDTKNIYRRADIINYMCRFFHLMDQTKIRPMIEDFIEDLFDVKPTVNTKKLDEALFILYNKKLELTGKYVTCASSDSDLETKREIAHIITDECLERFDLSGDKKCEYIGRDVLIKFIKYMQSESYTHHIVYTKHTNEVFNMIIETMQNRVPMEKVYFIIWDIHVDIAVRNAFINIYLHYSKVINFNEKLSKLREILLSFGSYIGNVIEQLVKKDKYLRNLTSIVVNKSFPHIMRIVKTVKEVEMDDLLVVISLALIKFKTPEHYMIALILVPDKYTGLYYTDYKEVLNEIMLCTLRDVTALMFHKFINVDYKRRDSYKLLASYRPKNVEMS